MKASIVITNYNGRNLLEKNLPKVIEAMKNKKNNIMEIIVVDDGSVDDSVNYLKKNFEEVRVIKHKVNRGFSYAANTGARMSKGDLIVLINNDVVPNKNFLEAIYPLFKDKKVFAVSFHEKGYGWAKGKFEDGYILHGPGKESKETHQTFWVNGGSGAWRRDVWMKLGGMDDKVLSPFYWEDIDLSYRAAKRGYQLLWEPNALVEHEHETTIGRFPKKKVQRIRERNHLLFIWKDLTSQNLFKKHVLGLIKRMIQHPGYVRIFLMALMRIRPVLKARKKERKETRVSDEALFSRFR